MGLVWCLWGSVGKVQKWRDNERVGHIVKDVDFACKNEQLTVYDCEWKRKQRERKPAEDGEALHMQIVIGKWKPTNNANNNFFFLYDIYNVNQNYNNKLLTFKNFFFNNNWNDSYFKSDVYFLFEIYFF